MSHPLVSAEEHEISQSTSVMRHCRSCFRDDLHLKTPWPPFMLGLLLVLTLGLIVFVPRTRCVCCGTTRLF